MTPRLAWLYAARPVEYYRELAGRGPSVRTWTPFGRGVVTGDPDVVDALFARNDLAPMRGMRLDEFFGASSPVGASGHEHASVRRRLRRPMAALDLVEVIAAEEAERELGLWPFDQPFALLPSMRRISLRVILRALAGRAGLLAEASAERWTETITAPLAALPVLRVPLAGFGPWDRHLRARAVLDGDLESLVPIAETSSILPALAAEAPSKRWLLDQLLSLIFAGHETTAVTLAWTLAWLLRTPAALAGAREGGEDALVACLNETMRISPLGDIPARIATTDMRLGGVDVRAGEAVIVAPWILHHRPDLWDAPDAFRPGRQPARPSAFVPFGGGARRCIGAALAWREMPAVLRAVLRSASLRLITIPEPRRIGLVIGPGDGVRVIRSRTS